MKRNKKTIALLLSAALICGIFSGCGDSSGGGSVTLPASTTDDPNKALDTTVDYDNLADIEEVNASYEEGTGPLYEQGKKVGTVKALCYYDLVATDSDLSEMLAENFGGKIEVQIVGSGEYFDALGKLVASGDSPDIVRYDWQAFPWGVSKNMYTNLDGWLDIESPLWSSDREIIEQFSFAGKHYYYPSTVSTTATTFALTYNRLLVEQEGLPDPAELYFNDEWTWDTFESMLDQWSNLGEEYIPLTTGSWGAMMFINSTGTKLVDVSGGNINNNLRDQNVRRTMEWIEKLRKENYIGDGYIHPADAFLDGKLLFLGMGLTWTLESAQEAFFKKGLDGEFVGVPIPRDPQADAYYMSGDTVGYLVPAGSQNIQGGVAWILCSRLHETDPDITAEVRADLLSSDPIYYVKCPECKYDYVENGTDELTICPECNTARREKFKVTYTEEQLRIIDEMNGGEKIKLVFDSVVGFDSDFSNIFTVGEESVLDGPMFFGSSFTQLSESNYQAIEAYLEPFRATLTAEG